MNMIEFCQVSKAFGENKILEQISFSVSRGETVALTGESGCGKTTVLRMIAGLEHGDSGQILLNGRRMTEDIPPHRRGIAMVFQEATLWNHLSVYGNIVYGMKPKDRNAVRDIAEALKIAELLERYPGEISGGQAKRVSLARALASNREIFLLDEPLSNLDVETRNVVLKVIKERCICGKTVIYVTHDKAEVEALGCRQLWLSGGRVKAC